MIKVEGFEPNVQVIRDENRFRWPLGPDIVEECSAVADLPVVEQDDWAPLFEPHDFAEEHGPLELDNYMLPQEDLKRWAEKVALLRAAIVSRAADFDELCSAAPQRQLVSNGR